MPSPMATNEKKDETMATKTCDRCEELTEMLENSAQFYENRARFLEIKEGAAAQLEQDVREVRVSLEQMATAIRDRLTARATPHAGEGK